MISISMAMLHTFKSGLQIVRLFFKVLQVSLECSKIAKYIECLCKVLLSTTKRSEISKFCCHLFRYSEIIRFAECLQSTETVKRVSAKYTHIILLRDT